jgi:hypothetical protein
VLLPEKASALVEGAWQSIAGTHRSLHGVLAPAQIKCRDADTAAELSKGSSRPLISRFYRRGTSSSIVYYGSRRMKRKVVVGNLDQALGRVFYRRAKTVTCPVLYRPMARAAAGDRSICRPRTHGPRSLIRTVSHPL